jgi:cobalt-zinc-cadmium efflux system protein
MRLSIVLVLNLVLIAALVIVGLTAHSIGVLAAGGDYLADAAAIGVALLAIWLSHRPPTLKRPFGYPNATKVAALINGSWLLILSVLVILSASHRLLTGTPRVHGLPVVAVSVIAAVVMLIGAFILHGDASEDDADEDFNVRAVLLDTAADAAAAAGVALSSGVILATGGWYWLDPAVALLIALIIGYHSIALLRDVLAALQDRNRVLATESSATSSRSAGHL